MRNQKPKYFLFTSVLLFMLGLGLVRHFFHDTPEVLWNLSFLIATLIPSMSLYFWSQKEAGKFKPEDQLSIDQQTFISASEIKPLVNNLAEKFKIKVPEVLFINSPKVFAYSYNFGSVGKIKLSKGLLDTYSRDSIEGILAHEMSHLQSKDTYIGLLRHIFCVWVLTVSFLLGLNILPLLFMGIVFYELFYSRKLEYQADQTALDHTSMQVVLSYMIDSLVNHEEKKIALMDKIKAGFNIESKIKSLLELLSYQTIVYSFNFFGKHPSWEKRINLLLSKNLNLSEKEISQLKKRLIQDKIKYGIKSSLKL